MPPRRDVSVFRDRIEQLRARALDAGASAMLVSNPTDVGYLTGFLGGDSWLVVPAKGKPTIISDRRYEEELDPHRPLARIVMRKELLAAALAEELRRHGFDDGRRKLSLGVQADHLTLAAHGAVAKALTSAKLKSKSTRPLTGLVAQLRRKKSPDEIRSLRKVLRIQQDALEEILPTISPRETELAICARLEAAMKTRGSTEPGFGPIVAAGPSAALPHYTPGSRKTKKGGVLLIDWGATHAGYRGDMTRTFSLGKWSKTMGEVYDIVLEAHEAAASALRAGVPCRDVDGVARTIIRKAGYSKAFGHSLGHGLGMDVHESPRLSHLAGPDEVLEEGDVVTIEPGIYLPGIGGVRIEDDYTITARGAKNLCTLPRDRAWSTL